LYPIQPAYAAAPPPSALNAFTEQRANPLLKLASTSPLATTSLIADRLEGLAFSTTSATSSGVRFIPLVISGAHAVGNSYGGNTPAPTSTVAGGSISQQTFTSRDLQYQPTASSSVSASTYGRLVQLYTQLRDVLARMLSLLRPFSVSNAIEAKKQQQLYGF
jgi:hypothetical protein